MTRKEFNINPQDRKVAVLIDPDKESEESVTNTINKLKDTTVDFIFVGGSSVSGVKMKHICKTIASAKPLQPVVLFPGAAEQVNPHCDAMLFLNLISGRNPEFLIGQQVKGVETIAEFEIPLLSTGYMVLDGGIETSVLKISQTTALSQEDVETIRKTALAGCYMGMSAIYLDAGSGAQNKVSPTIIHDVKKAIQTPLFVGGGLKSLSDIEEAFTAGANLVVIGNHIEANPTFVHDLVHLQR